DKRQVRQSYLRNAARDCRILGNSGHEFVDLVLTKGVLRRERIIAAEPDAELIDQRRIEAVGPSNHCALSLEHLASPRRSGSSIANAAKKSRNETVAIGITVAHKDRVIRRWHPIHPSVVTVPVVGEERVAHKVVQLARKVGLRKQRHNLGGKR